MNPSRCLPFLLLALARPVSAAPIDDPHDPDPEPEGSPEEDCVGAFTEKYNSLLASGINLGLEMGPITVHSSWCSKIYTGGRLYSWAPSGGRTNAVYGSVLAEYATVGFDTGFGPALSDPVPDGTGAVRARFGKGVIVVHPMFGSHAIYTALSSLWELNNTNITDVTSARFGYPTTDQIANPFGLGAYTHFQYGYTARTNDFGSWIDFTGNGEGATSATVTLYPDASFLGSSLARSFSGPSPVALRPQLGTLDERTSSLTVAMPTRTSLYLFADSPLEGRYVSISGADNATVKVANIGTWMNDRTSSMLFVNHGTASGRSTVADLVSQVQTAITGIDTHALLATALAGTDAEGWLTWTGTAAVELIPGERLIKITKRAYLDVDGPYWTDGDGTVEFIVYVRPYVASDFKVHVSFVHGDAISISCSGWACDDRNDALATLFSNTTVQSLVETAFNNSLDEKLAPLPDLAGQCGGISVRRVNVLPTFIEVVVADTTTAANCAAPLVAAFAPGLLDFNRPRGRVQNSDNIAFNGVVTVASNIVIMK